MKKTFTVFALALFVFAMALGLASATLTVAGVPSKLSQETSSFDITITSTENETASFSITDILDSDNTYRIDFAEIEDVVLNESNARSATVTIYYTVQSGFEFEFGKSYSTILYVDGTTSPEVSQTLNFEETGFCSSENTAKISLEIEDIKVVSGFGDEDEYWYLMDEIEFELTIEPSDYDIEDVEVEWELYSTSGKKVDSGDFSVSDIDEGDDETVTFTIKLDSKIDEFDSENAVLYIRAIGNIDDKDSAYDGDESCDWVKEEVEVNTQDNFVVVSDLMANDEEIEEDAYHIISCGQSITLSGDVWNIGEDDQDDVSVELYSKNLGVDEAIEFNSIDAFDSDKFSYTFEIPENLEAGTHSLTIEVRDEDNDVFENDEDDKAVFTILFKLEDSCLVEDPTVTAELIGDSYAGKYVVVKAYVRNNNNKESTFVVTADGFESWAKLSNVEPRTFTLGAGEATEVELTFVPNKDSLGEYSFNIQLLMDGKDAISQPASINVQKSTFNIKDYMTKENLQIAGIVLLNLILLIAIIIVARKILRKK